MDFKLPYAVFVRDAVFQSLGIEIEKSSVGINFLEEEIQVSVHGMRIGSIFPQEDDGEIELRFLMDEIVEDQQPAIRDLLIALKTEELEIILQEELKAISDWIVKRIAKFNPEVNYYVGVENIWYTGNHWEMEEEYIRGYPRFAIKVTDFDEMEYFHEFNIDDVPMDIDIEQLKSNLRVRILGVG